MRGVTGPPLFAENRRRPRVEYAPHKKTILTVDDEPEILEAVSVMLVDPAYNIITASSGLKGLQQSREFEGEIDLLLSASRCRECLALI
jgi:response regulator RpfG family c-di-GMP phosphodiesterase